MMILLFFRFVPFFLANSLFRICAFALIIVFLDWWSVIPFVLLLFLNLVKSHIFVVLKYLIACAQVVFGLSFRRFSSTSSPPASDHSLSAVELNRLSTMEVKKETKKPNSGHVACEKAPWSCCAVDSLELWICVERWSRRAMESVELWIT